MSEETKQPTPEEAVNGQEPVEEAAADAAEAGGKAKKEKNQH